MLTKMYTKGYGRAHLVCLHLFCSSAILKDPYQFASVSAARRGEFCLRSSPNKEEARQGRPYPPPNLRETRQINLRTFLRDLPLERRGLSQEKIRKENEKKKGHASCRLVAAHLSPPPRSANWEKLFCAIVGYDPIPELFHSWLKWLAVCFQMVFCAIPSSVMRGHSGILAL